MSDTEIVHGGGNGMHPTLGYQLLNGVRRYKSRIMYRSLSNGFEPLNILQRLFGSMRSAAGISTATTEPDRDRDD